METPVEELKAQLALVQEQLAGKECEIESLTWEAEEAKIQHSERLSERTVRRREPLVRLSEPPMRLSVQTAWNRRWRHGLRAVSLNISRPWSNSVQNISNHLTERLIYVQLNSTDLIPSLKNCRTTIMLRRNCCLSRLLRWRSLDLLLVTHNLSQMGYLLELAGMEFIHH